jgi:5-methyltetrahydrofolate--homocysteine methyltransferase
MPDYEGIQKSLYEGNANRVKELVQKAIEEGCDAQEILTQGLIQGMQTVGADFKNCVIYVPEVLVAARAMKAGAELLKPLLAAGGVKPSGTMVLGTVKGDLHDIGKNLVGMMAEGAGLKVVDIGVDASAEKFVTAIKQNNANLIGMSALLTTTMVNMKEIVQAVRSSADTKDVKIMIGGAPVTQQFADEIGADGYAPDAASAADRAKELIGIA